ncbi:MAG: DUF2955 domain-containing protein [Thiotrichales bacterium]
MSFSTALSLAAGYALQLHLPYLAPMFALLLTMHPAPPPGPKKLLAIITVIPLTLGIGLLLIPLLVYYPLPAVLLVGLGLYASFYLTVNKGKAILGLFLTMGLTLISAAGTLSSVLAALVIQSLVISVAVAILSQWLVYPFFPEDSNSAKAKPEPDESPQQSSWIALRATLIMLPAYFLVLSNPSLYLPVIMKSVSLSQQSSLISARNAGRELLGSTFLGGCFAIAFWGALGLATNLWMFFLWTLLFTSYFAAKIHGVIASRFPPSFWQNIAVTMLILLGSAVMDSNNGKDVYVAFYTRMSLFIAVTLYAWLTVYLLEIWRGRRIDSRESTEPSPC